MMRLDSGFWQTERKKERGVTIVRMQFNGKLFLYSLFSTLQSVQSSQDDCRNTVTFWCNVLQWDWEMLTIFYELTQNCVLFRVLALEMLPDRNHCCYTHWLSEQSVLEEHEPARFALKWNLNSKCQHVSVKFVSSMLGLCAILNN